MPKRRRFVTAMAAGSAAALVGALSTGFTVAGLASTGEGNGGVTATWSPAASQLVAHYTVSPAQRPDTATRSAGTDSRQLPRLNKFGKNSVVHNSAGPLSDNTNAVSAAGSAKLATPTNQSGESRAKASFIGQQSSATTCSYFGPGCNPPDMAIAASTQFVLQGVNSQFEVLDTSGHVQPGFPVSAQNFFGVPNVTNTDGTPCDTAHRSQPFMSDPRALYDPIDNRFWAAMLQVENALGIAADCPFKSVYYIAVSQTSDPRGRWNVYEFNMSLDGQFAADFTQIGLNGDAVYFSANMFGPSTGLNGGFYGEIFEANKSKMERGKASFTADGFFNMKVTGPGNTAATGPLLADTLNPALNLDGSGGPGEPFTDTMDGPDPMTGHFCGFFGGGAADSCSGLGLWRMTNPIGHDSGGGAPKLSFTLVPTKPFIFSAPSDQPSCNQCIDPSDLRISATPIVRGGVLYGAWETGLSNGSQVVPSIEWARVRLGSDVSARTGYYNFSGDTSASYPALMPDSYGNVVMLYERMSSTIFPETRFIVSGEDGQFHGAGTLLKAGDTNYRPQLCGTANLPVCRWGDYSAASFDGSGTIWVAGEYANQLNLGPPQNGRNWGTWIGAVSAS
ncbi:MAG TPA: hypothetical protein VHW94_10510 [Candidatus Dormibacteraeota bacterium]|nr:hypothetical protein [Candidatus Dormibacteraeota bacterium]